MKLIDGRYEIKSHFVKEILSILKHMSNFKEEKEHKL